MTHQYPAHVTWTGGRTGSGTVGLHDESHSVPLAVPAELSGTGQGTSPEELLVSAVAGCYAVTLGIVAEHRRVPVTAVDVRATGDVDQEGTRLTYSAITIRPRVRLAAGATDEQARQALDIAHRADKYCVITNAVRDTVKVTVEPEIVRD
jgi:peroxiredoxin-like protein